MQCAAIAGDAACQALRSAILGGGVTHCSFLQVACLTIEGLQLACQEFTTSVAASPLHNMRRQPSLALTNKFLQPRAGIAFVTHHSNPSELALVIHHQ
jgi:hypothetical protein